MTHFDLFNGDADGLCAPTRLRNARPRDVRLISGVNHLPSDVSGQFIEAFAAFYA